MAKRVFRPTLWATICTVISLGILISLGSWQVKRAGWKAGEIAKMEERAEQSPVPLLPFLMGENGEYRSVTASGQPVARFFLFGQKRKNVPGFHLLDLLVLDGTRRHVIVNRGWVDEDWAETNTEPEADPISITASIQRLPRKNALSAVNPEDGPLLRIDSADIAARAGVDLDQMADMMLVVAQDDAPDQQPIPHVIEVRLPDNHWHYALTWFSLALALSVIYVTYHLKPVDPQQE
ncbi:MAG: SURF1 family protein [Alphaproteobacteria bacterium]